jgi:23S rRNA (cytidine1920-2'-O)/16S rRNA (cytidine1409-2'-O)-methyltransferase
MAPTLLEELMRRHPEMTEREARGRIMRGDVLLGTEGATKAGMRVSEGVPLTLRPSRPYASRGGSKLAAALTRLGIAVEGKCMIDAGSSTGGFTDCLLRRGASHVYAVDVGRNQLSWRLRQDPRVSVLEGTNVMDLGPSHLRLRPDGSVCDLSFRSIRGASSRLVSLVTEHWLLALVKPQYEWRLPAPGFRGVVRDGADTLAILTGLAADLREEGLSVVAACGSGLPGRRGNREFFFLIRGDGPSAVGAAELESAVREGLA